MIRSHPLALLFSGIIPAFCLCPSPLWSADSADLSVRASPGAVVPCTAYVGEDMTSTGKV